ncbi:transcriptional regulator, Spx/MgsR family [Cyclobacterium lianum]|uniref:Transcriptional regulator, Spx/MgsR family n=1 Tax=Cyclobacterium lianum TaxID=388280 RepID=A0A1M7IY39_9BACT|nr:Spx/MgsR family RNA polymerase-binding regulatory protein [Cyclobacterium lianum]SHM45666.1 transcriptional regulator, Spx/MgsR family [Cyclobacterium lianum]
MKTKIYGIKNCNTMKKTFALFEAEGKAYDFVDYKKEKPDNALLEKFIDTLGLETVVNKRGTTYKRLDDTAKKDLDKKESAMPILREKSSMIKRPILIFEDGSMLAGLDEASIRQKI